MVRQGRMGSEVNKPFGPALNAAVNLLLQATQQNVNAILNEEAKSLGLPEGTTADVAKREWVVPE
jgi:hypothetical protein